MSGDSKGPVFFPQSLDLKRLDCTIWRRGSTFVYVTFLAELTGRVVGWHKPAGHKGRAVSTLASVFPNSWKAARLPTLTDGDWQ
jgi:hypothetical protein